MKGYLSRIASQTGLRFSAQGAVPPRVADETPAETSPAPLDCEETVMAPPSVETKRADAGALKSGLTRERLVADPVEPGPAKPRKMEASSDESLVSHAAKTEPTEIVKTVYGNGSVIKEKHENHTQEPGKNAPTAPKEAEKRTEKHHFSQTAEVIGGRHAEPVAVQTILLRELQEWVAAGHTAEARPRAEADCSIDSVALGTETLETQEVVSTTEPEPGSVRIGQKRHRESIPKEDWRIEEQSFDLSIGTISVVIEGDEHLPQRASAPRAENLPSGQDRRRGRSRLGRSYL